ILYGRRVPHRDRDHRTVPRGDRRRDFKRRPRWIRTDCDWPRTDHVSPCRHTDIECFAQSSTCDRDGDIWWIAGTQRTVAVLGRPYPGWRDWWRYLPLAAGRNVQKERAALGRPFFVHRAD